MKIIKIGLTCTPSKVINNIKIQAEEILISYGGGMGGANETLYAQSVDVISDGFIILSKLNGERIRVNTANIVTRRFVNIIRVAYDITDHYNYEKKTVDYRAEIKYYLLPFATGYEIINKYLSHSEQPKSVYSYDDVTELGCSEEEEVSSWCGSCGDNMDDESESLKLLELCSACV